MTAAARLKLSESDEAELWRRYRSGESFSEIGRALGRTAGTIYSIVFKHGGFSPHSPLRNARLVSLREREEISRGISADLSIRRIATQLGRAASSVSPEIRRHGGRTEYRAACADQRAWQRARRAKRGKLAQHPRLREAVIAGLKQNGSPKQIQLEATLHQHN